MSYAERLSLIGVKKLSFDIIMYLTNIVYNIKLLLNVCIGVSQPTGPAAAHASNSPALPGHHLALSPHSPALSQDQTDDISIHSAGSHVSNPQ